MLFLFAYNLHTFEGMKKQPKATKSKELEDLSKIFSPILARLYQLENSDFDPYKRVDASAITDEITQQIFGSINYQILLFLRNIQHRVFKIYGNIDEIVSSVNLTFISIKRSDFSPITSEFVKSTKLAIESEMIIYNSWLSSLYNNISQILEELDINGNRIKVALSVPQLAALFRILYDMKIIDTDNESELSRNIVTFFETIGKSRSSDAIYNAYTDVHNEQEGFTFWQGKSEEFSEKAHSYPVDRPSKK